MSGNFQKTPFTSTQNAFASRKAQDAISILGKSLPASVAAIPNPGVPIVTVKFEINDPTFTTLPNVTLPVIGSEYIRIPLQAASGGTLGTQGLVVSADAYLGGVSGLGGGTADLTQLANLATLFFIPLGNKAFTAVDPNYVVTYGAAGGGAVMQDTIKKTSSVSVNSTGLTEVAPQLSMATSDGKSTVTMTSASITLSSNGHSIVINSTGILLDGKVFATHAHSGVQGGPGNTGPVV